MVYVNYFNGKGLFFQLLIVEEHYNCDSHFVENYAVQGGGALFYNQGLDYDPQTLQCVSINCISKHNYISNRRSMNSIVLHKHCVKTRKSCLH